MEISMELNNLQSNQQRLESNRNYSAKLSWKRKETLQLRSEIKEFIEINFDIQLPISFKKFKDYCEGSEKYREIYTQYGELVKAYYTLGNYGESIGSLFDTGNGIEIFTNAHLFSKHRIDPVWNWKKSKLIRSIYHKYLKETKIYNHYTPCHITLTMPHKHGLYKGKSFYAKELIEAFNLIRKSDWWKKYVYAGEYGIEVTGSAANGLHIHLHSLAFLRVSHLKAFREKLTTEWQKATGATETWVESLYIHKRDEKNRFIMTPKFNNSKNEFELVRKKFYLQDETKSIAQSALEPQEKEDKIIEIYTKAILETIKYHIKGDSIKLDGGTYNIFLINEILQNTKGKRLYSRYGQFYKEPLLNFNRQDKEAPDETALNEANTETVIDPRTMQEVPISETQIVKFYPEKLTYTGKLSSKPHTPINVFDDDIELLESKSIKLILKLMLEGKFKRRKKALT